MNKRDFLQQLEKELHVLDKLERLEIMDFYEERFHTGMIYEGKTEEEIIAELEHPRVIARNVLDEYGVSPRFVKKKEERYENVNTLQVILVLCFDLFVVTWLVPALFSVGIAIFGSCITWITTLPLLQDPVYVNLYLFWFLTAAYILLFMFGLVVLEMFIFVIKKTIIWHLNVFKVKNRDKFIKRASRFSVDGFFKRHRLVKLIKNLALTASIVVVAVTGVWLVQNYDSVREYHTEDLTVENYTRDFTTDIGAGEEWNLIIDADVYDVEIDYVDSTEYEFIHKYYEKEHFTYTIDEATNEIQITDKDPNPFNVRTSWSLTDLFQFLNRSQEIIVYLPRDLDVNVIDTQVNVGEVSIRNIEFNNLITKTDVGAIYLKDMTIIESALVDSNTGYINLENIVASFDGTFIIENETGATKLLNVDAKSLDIKSMTGTIKVYESTSSFADALLKISTDTGHVKVYDSNYDYYNLSTDTGGIDLDKLNTSTAGKSLTAECDTGNVTLEDVYVLSVTLSTETGNITYHNSLDTSFKCTSLTVTTSVGNKDITVTD